MTTALERAFPELEWRLSTQMARLAGPDQEIQPTRLLDMGEAELSRQHLDFVFIWTDRELTTVWQDHASIMPSRAFAAAILSSFDDNAPQDDRQIDHLTRLLAYLAGLDTLDELGSDQRCQALSDQERQALVPLLAAIADLRLEESETPKRSFWTFAMRTVRLNAGVVWRAWVEARPWRLPFWLSGLVTASISALVVLIVTAEAWEVGTHLNALQAIGLAGFSVIVSSLFLLRRQGLLISTSQNRLTELRVVTDFTTVLCVFTGMATAFLGLFAAALLTGLALFDADLIAKWIGRPDDGWARSGMADLVASIGLIVGALGASFEGKARFRHLLHIDAELPW